MVMDIMYGQQKVGSGKVVKSGLYYEIHCRCFVEEGGFHRIHIRGSSGSADLGICLRKENMLYVDKRVPQHALGSRLLSISVSRGWDYDREEGILLELGRPFDKFPDLECAILMTNNRKSYLAGRLCGDDIS